MARPIKTGLDYFPFSVDTYSDRKLRRMIRNLGAEAAHVHLLLLCYIFRDGYFMEWDEDYCYDIAECTCLPEETVQRVVEYCVELGLFEPTLFRTCNVLTSASLQQQYLEIAHQARRKSVIDRYNLLGCDNNTGEIEVDSAETASDVAVMPQRKENKNKLNQTRINNNKRKENEIEENKEEPQVSRVSSPSSSSEKNLNYNYLNLDFRIESMKDDKEWLALFANHYQCPLQEIVRLLDEDFRLHCLREQKDHNGSITDARRHFSRWLDIQMRTTERYTAKRLEKKEGAAARVAESEPAKPKRVAPTEAELRRQRDAERAERERAFDERQHKAVTADDYIRRRGYDPAKVTMAQLISGNLPKL